LCEDIKKLKQDHGYLKGRFVLMVADRDNHKVRLDELERNHVDLEKKYVNLEKKYNAKRKKTEEVYTPHKSSRNKKNNDEDEDED
jgi:hypothetical protein